jgi:hypothetical protein
MSGVETCPECRDTGIISRPYIAGVVSTMTACHCDAGRQFAADIAAQRARVAELEAATDQLQYIASANATRAEKADTDLIRRGDAMDLRDELADVIGARPLSSIHSALSEYRKAIRALPAHPAQEPPSPGVTAGATRPERLWLWPECHDDGMDKAVSFPDQLYPSGSTEYIRADLATPAPVVPAEGLDPERLVMAWMSEMEGFATRGERFMDTITDGNDVAPWLHAACQVGIDAALRSAPPVGARVIAEKAYLAGFNAAGEGYNGEWPFHDKGISPDTDEGWLIGRDMALAALLPAGEGE